MRFSPPSGVLYAEDFDAPEPAVMTPSAEPVPPPEPVVIEPTFSLADLRRATERAEEEARAQERREAAEADCARTADALALIADALIAARSENARIAAAAASATADTVLAMVAAVLPAFASAQGAKEIAALLHLLLPAMTHQPRLTIRVHASLVDGLRNELAAAQEDGQTAIDWLESTTMLPGDLTVRWQDGIMFRDTHTLCAKISDLVMPHCDRTENHQETRDGE